jgi:hypothetical protein
MRVCSGLGRFGTFAARAALAATLALGLFVAGGPVEAQPTAKIPRIGILLLGTPDTDPTLSSFRAGLRDLGYVEGKNIVLEYRYAEESRTGFPTLPVNWRAASRT